MRGDGTDAGVYGGDGTRVPLCTGLPARRLLFGFVVWLWAQRPDWTVSRLARVLRAGQRFGFLIARVGSPGYVGPAGGVHVPPTRPRERNGWFLVAVAPSWDGMLRRTMRTHFR